MKKIFATIFLLFALISKAQLNPFTFGLLYTANGTTFDAKPGIGTLSPEIGHGLSGFARLKILFLYAELEAGYSTHNLSSTQTVFNTDVTTNYTLNGLDLSGIIGWRIIGIGPLGNIRLFTGYNFNNYTTITVETNGSSVTNPGINTGNSGLIFGAGVDIWKIVVNLKYISGLTNLSSTSNQELKTGILAMSLGFKF